MTIDAGLKIGLCRHIALHRRRQELYLDTIADSAILAAQQVQDKQLELLKTPPEFTLMDAILEIILSYVPFSALAGRALSAFLSTTLNHVLRTRAAFAIFSKSEMGNWLAGATKSTIDTIRATNKLRDYDAGLLIFGAKQAQGELLRTENVRIFYSDFVQKLADGNALVTGAQRITTSVAKIFHPELRAEDSPGVAVCDMAMSFARQQKAAQNFICDQLTLEAQCDVMTPDEAVNCYEFFYMSNQNLDRTIHDLSAVRLRAIRVFEMVIWTRIIPEVKWRMNGGDSQLVGINAPISKALSDYFINRFFQGPDNTSYAEAYPTVAESVYHLGLEWNQSSEDLQSCKRKVDSSFASQQI